jgi:O-antigen/teichoic acid export membrane protein
MAGDAMTHLLAFITLAVVIGLAFFHRPSFASGAYWGFFAGAVCATLVGFAAMAEMRRKRLAELSALVRQTLPSREDYD